MKNLLYFLRQHQARYLALGVLVFLGVTTFLTLSLVKERQELRKEAVEPDNGRLTFSNLNPGRVLPGGTFTLRVDMDNGGQPVEGADIVVLFDNNKLTLQDTKTYQDVTGGEHPVFKTYAPINAGGNLDKSRVISQANAGREIKLGILAFDWSTDSFPGVNAGNSSAYPVVELHFQVKAGAALGPTDLTFKNQGILITTDSNIVVSPAGGKPEDILQAPPYSNDTARVNIVSPTPTPTPVPTATPRPTNTPTPVPTSTPRPTATPRPTNTPTPGPTATPVLTSTPVPILTSTPTPMPTPGPTSTPGPTATPVLTSTPVPTTPPGVPGDANGDGKVNALDYTIFFEEFGLNLDPAKDPQPRADFNDDWKVNALDYVILFSNWGYGT